MRADARTLLDRLGRSDFAYKEFADRFSDLELWPLFEALLKDPRVFRQDSVALSEPSMPAEAVAAPGIAGARPTGVVPRGPDVPTPPVEQRPGAQSLSDLFSRYESEGQAEPDAPAGQDVRAILRRLSDLDERGEL
jgi:hypothetical protein